MEKGELKTGQLLGIKEKNGKLIREYVAGFFGDEPIIKQRLLTPQEARRYREDLERGKKEGKSQSEATRTASLAGTGPALARTGKVKKKLIRKRPVGQSGDEPRSPEGKAAETATRPRTPGMAGPAASPSPEPAFAVESRSVNESYIQSLIEGEPEKPDISSANKQKAIDAISKIGSPEMKIYKLGITTKDKKEAEFYSQKEFIARNVLGLPFWRPKPEPAEPEPQQTGETSPLDAAESDEKETALATAEETSDASAAAVSEEHNEE